MIGGDDRTSLRELSSSAKSRGCPEVLVTVESKLITEN